MWHDHVLWQADPGSLHRLEQLTAARFTGPRSRRERDMMAETTPLGMDVSRDWRDGFCRPGEKRFRHPDTAEGHIALVAMIRQLSGPAKVGFEAAGGQKWLLWTELSAAGTAAVQLPPAHPLETLPRDAVPGSGSRPSRFLVARGRRPTGSMRNSSPGSWHADREPGENGQMKTCAFSEPWWPGAVNSSICECGSSPDRGSKEAGHSCRCREHER